jgi:hypothetical protein
MFKEADTRSRLKSDTHHSPLWPYSVEKLFCAARKSSPQNTDLTESSTIDERYSSNDLMTPRILSKPVSKEFFNRIAEEQPIVAVVLTVSKVLIV